MSIAYTQLCTYRLFWRLSGDFSISYMSLVMGKKPLKAYANSKVSGETARMRSLARTFAVRSLSGRPRENFSQRTRYVVLLWGRACALKEWFDGKSKEPFSSRGGPYEALCIGLYNVYSLWNLSLCVLLLIASFSELNCHIYIYFKCTIYIIIRVILTSTHCNMILQNQYVNHYVKNNNDNNK